MLKRIPALFSLVILTSCQSLHPYESDYLVLSSSHIDEMIVGNTLEPHHNGDSIFLFLAGGDFIRFAKGAEVEPKKRDQDFKVEPAHFGKYELKGALYGKGKWTTRAKTLNGKHVGDEICWRIRNTFPGNSKFASDCFLLVRNGGKFYRNNLTDEPDTLHQGDAFIRQTFLTYAEKSRSTTLVRDYRNYFGNDANSTKLMAAIDKKRSTEKTKTAKRSSRSSSGGTGLIGAMVGGLVKAVTGGGSSTSSSSRSSNSGAPNYVMVQADMTCGVFLCSNDNLTLSGGPGQVSENAGASATIHKGYNGIAGTYRYTITYDGNKTCSGTINVSGRKQNGQLNVYSDSCDGTYREF